MFTTPTVYIAFHVLTGIVSFYYTPLIPVMIIYQFLQYALHRRFFLLEGEIKEGNSFIYTLYKLSHFFIGYFLGYFGYTFYQTHKKVANSL